MKCNIVSLIGDKKIRELFPELEVFSEVDKFILCKSYDVAIKYYKKSEEIENRLNIFEITILRFLNTTNFSLENISKKMGLDINFVEYLCNVLIENKYLSKDLKVLEKGKELLGSNSDNENKIRTECISLFQETFTNSILPYKSYEKSYIYGEYDDSLSNNKHIISFKIGNVGNEKEIKFEVLKQKHEKQYNEIPNNKLKKALEKFKGNDSNIYIKNNEAELHFSKGEDVYFHIKAYTLKNDVSKIFYTDGKNQILNLDLKKYENYFRILIQKNEIKESKKNGKNSLYPKIIIYGDYKNNFENTNIDKNEKKFEDMKKIFEYVYSNFEISLYYYLKKVIDNSKLKAYINSDNNKKIKEEIEKSLKNYGQNLYFISENKFESKKKVEHLYDSFRKGKFDSIYKYDADPDLKTLFPLMLLDATIHIENPFNYLLKDNKNFIKDVYKFNELRNMLFHKSDIKEKTKIENGNEEIEITFKDYIDKSIECLEKINKTILKIDFKENFETFEDDYSRKKNNAIYKAVTDYQELYTTLPEGLKSILLKLVDYDTLLEENSKLDIIILLSKFLENYLKLKLRNLNLQNKSYDLDNVINNIERKIDKNIPIEIKNSNKQNIKKALEDKKSTLQGIVIAYYYREEAKLLKELESKYEFLNIVKYVSKKRGHGNNHGFINITDEEIMEYKNKVLDIINEINNN